MKLTTKQLIEVKQRVEATDLSWSTKECLINNIETTKDVYNYFTAEGIFIPLSLEA